MIANASIIFNLLQIDPKKRLSVRDYKLQLVDGLLRMTDETIDGGGYHLCRVEPITHQPPAVNLSRRQQQRWHAARVHPAFDGQNGVFLKVANRRLLPSHHALVPVHKEDGSGERGDCWGCKRIVGNVEAIEIAEEYFGSGGVKRATHRVQTKCNVCGEFFCPKCHFMFHSFPCVAIPIVPTTAVH